MNDKIKLKLIRTFPNLFKSDIELLAYKYKIKYIPEKYKETHPEELFLEEILSEKFSKSFANYLKREFNCLLRLDEYTPDALKNNPDFINWIAHNNPICILQIPNNMMKEEYVKIFETFLLREDISIVNQLNSDEYIPKMLATSEIITKKIIRELNSLNYYYNSFYTTIINNYEDCPNNLNMIIESVHLLDFGYYYRYLTPKLQKDERIIKLALDRKSLNIKLIPKEKQDFANKYFLELINSGKKTIDGIYYELSYEGYYFDKDVNRALLRQYQNHNNDEITANQIYELINPIRLEDIYLYPEDKKILYEIYIKSPKFWYMFDSFFDKEYLFMYLLDEKKIDYIYKFNSKMIEKHIIDILNYNDNNKENPINLKEIINIDTNNTTIFSAILNKMVDDETFFTENIEIFNTHYLALEKKECYTLIFKLDKMYNNPAMFNIIKRYKYNYEILNWLIDTNKLEYLHFFYGCVHDKEAINKLKLLIPIKELNFYATELDIEDNLEFNSNEELEKVISLNKDNEINSLLLIIRNAKKYNVNSPSLDKIIKEADEYLKDKSSIYKSCIDRALNSERKLCSIEYVKSENCLIYFNNIGDILSTVEQEFIDSLPLEILNKVNAKHIRIIMDLLIQKKYPHVSAVSFSLQIYCALGFEKAKELLTDTYGSISYPRISSLFENISLIDIMFKKEGNGYVPILNDKLINLVFGANKRVNNTPIKNYLNNYIDKKEEMNKERKAIEDDPLLDEETKKQRIADIETIEKKYIKENDKFINRLSRAFNEWDIIEEEFIKAQNVDKRKIKVNPERINSILDYVDIKRKNPALESRDQVLLQTDIFDYLGKDTKFFCDTKNVIPRTIHLSRGMDGIETKKFPNVNITQGNLTLSTFNPQDRNILTMGFKSNCCFRPTCLADDNGKDTSLLRYCTNTTYGGGIQITDEKGNVLMFSPIIRNGNVLMIHSFESEIDFSRNSKKEKKRLINELLVAYAEEVIKQAQEHGDDISFVVITNLHDERLSLDLIKGELPQRYKFTIFDEDNNFTGMYNNLTSSHMILANKEGASFKDIHYGPVTVDYKYNIEHSFYSVDLNPELLINIEKLKLLKNQIILISNQKELARTNEDYDTAYTLQKEIVKVKKEYLELYKKILDSNRGHSIIDDYNRALSTIKEICDTNKTTIPQNNKRFIIGYGWYIIITEDGRLIGDCLDFAKIDYERRFKYNLEFYPDLIPFPNGIKEDIVNEVKTI